MTDGLTVGAVVANAARGAPAATAAVIHGQAHTFAELDEAGNGCAHRLVAAGVGPGQVAVSLGSTSFDLLAQFVGCARAGVVFAPLDPSHDDDTIAAVGRRLRPAVWLVDADQAAPGPRHLIARPDRDDATVTPSAGDLPAVTADDDHVAFFTSGSTGPPKAAVLSHRTSVLRSHPGSQLERRGPALCPYPLFHMGGWTITLQQWHARAAVVFVEGTDAQTLCTALLEHHIERFNAIPALWTRLAEHVGAHSGVFPDLRFADTGTSPTSVALLEQISAMAPNAAVRVFYGSTEAGNVASLDHHDITSRPGSCGRPGPLTEVTIGPDDELLVRGPLLFDRYLADPEATAAACRHGWYHSGDRAAVDDDGFISIIGRMGTLIRTGGEAVDPKVVESALRTHPDITDVAVFGVTDPQWGETVWVAVVSDTELTVTDLRAHLSPGGAQPLAPHHHPRHLIRVSTLPRTAATGQIDRHRLRTLARKALA